MISQGIKQYKSLDLETSIMDADPHRLIQLLFEGAVARLSAAKGHIERGAIEERSKTINSVVQIIGGLRESLNMDAGELALNLERLYDYMERRLFEANINSDEAIVDEVLGLLNQIKNAWDDIRPEVLANNLMSEADAKNE